MKEKSFFKTVMSIALPVALQSMLQSSFSMIDQIMVGQLGTSSIAAIGVAGKFAFMYSTIIGAVGAICGIMVSQYMGQCDYRRRNVSASVSMALVLFLAVIFIIPSVIFPRAVMRAYSSDLILRGEAANYLRIISANYPAIGISAILGVILRCNNRSAQPLYASIITALSNTGLNYCLIFGKLGFPALKVNGAGIASVISGWIGVFIILYFFISMNKKEIEKFHVSFNMTNNEFVAYIKMLIPLVLTEFMWSLGQNVYAGIYGHVGTKEMAAVQLISPIEALTIGALSGLEQAAGILIGKSLGAANNDKAYRQSKQLILYGVLGSFILAGLVITFRNNYTAIFNVDENVRINASNLLLAFALLSPFKVFNMIMGGGIIRSGGKTDYVMWIDILGTWFIGVPVGIILTQMFQLPIVFVYFGIGLEEIVRAIISAALFKSKKWMIRL